MKSFFYNLLFIYFLSFVSCGFANEIKTNSEFVFSKTKKKNVVSVSKLRELIIENYRDILKIDLKFNKFSTNLRELILSEIEDYFDADDNFLTLANKEQLNELLENLVLLKKDLEGSINSFIEKLSNVKNRFKLNPKKL